jgi:hypothetical protein
LSRHARKDGGNYQKADYHAEGVAPFEYKIRVQTVPAGVTYPECFSVVDKDGKIVAWLTDRQVRAALDRFDEVA